jgi:hypothetical protein
MTYDIISMLYSASVKGLNIDDIGYIDQLSMYSPIQQTWD